MAASAVELLQVVFDVFVLHSSCIYVLATRNGAEYHMFTRLKLLGWLGLPLLCLSTLSGTDAPRPSVRSAHVPVAGLIPPQVIDALSSAAGTAVKRLPYAGSLGILDGMRSRSLEFGAITSDAAYLAFTGGLDTHIAPFETLRGMTVLELKTIHLMVGKHRHARSIAELRGMNVSLGPPGTGTALVSERLLDAHGLTLDDLTEEYLSIADAAKRLTDGSLDAAFMPMVAPGVDAAAAARGGAQLLEIAGPKVEELRLQYPFLLRTSLPGGSYPGHEKQVQTIAVDLLLVCRADADERLVYDVLQAYFKALSHTTAVIDLNRATGMSIPLHPGAARYYRERELSR
jgi:TRAP transporter TAXI family solute receptor